MPHYRPPAWTTEYWYVFSPQPGAIVKDDVTKDFIEGWAKKEGDVWVRRGGHRQAGKMIYKFQDQKTRTTVVIAIDTYRPCFQFAARIYDDIKAGKWQKESLV